MIKIKSKGFTLIELLVVIAIIGILSSVVLASLNAAKGKAADSKVKAQLASARDAAELFYEANQQSYNGATGDVLWDCTTIDTMFQDSVSEMALYTDAANNYPVGTDMRCSSNSSEYSISASLQTPGEFWCIDSTGASKLVSALDHATAHPDGDTTCN